MAYLGTCLVVTCPLVKGLSGFVKSHSRKPLESHGTFVLTVLCGAITRGYTGGGCSRRHPLTEPHPQVLLCASSQTSSLVECWSLRKEGLPVNNIFQQISPVGESFRVPS